MKKNWTIKHLVILSIKHGGLDLQNWWLRDWFKLGSRLGRNSSRTASYFGVSYRMDKEHKLRTRVGLSQKNSGIQKIRPHVGRMFWSWITMFSFDDKCSQIPKLCHCIERKSREQGATVVLKIVPATSSNTCKLFHPDLNTWISTLNPGQPLWRCPTFWVPPSRPFLSGPVLWHSIARKSSRNSQTPKVFNDHLATNQGKCHMSTEMVGSLWKRCSPEIPMVLSSY
jgi:hypothetical protein